MTPEDAKRALRRTARATRRSVMDPSMRAQAAAEVLLGDARLAASRCVAAYLATGSEIDPAPLVSRLRARGSIIALPAVVAIDTPLVFRRWTGEAETLVADAAGRLAPPIAAAQVDPDLVIAPLLAFDARGGRLGQGGGYYDRALARLRAGGRVFALGLAFAAQEIDEAPMQAHDARLDGVLTEAGLRLFPSSREF